MPHGNVGEGVQKSRYDEHCSDKSRGYTEHLGVEYEQKYAGKGKGKVVCYVSEHIAELVAQTESPRVARAVNRHAVFHYFVYLREAFLFSISPVNKIIRFLAQVFVFNLACVNKKRTVGQSVFVRRRSLICY